MEKKELGWRKKKRQLGCKDRRKIRNRMKMERKGKNMEGLDR